MALWERSAKGNERFYISSIVKYVQNIYNITVQRLIHLFGLRALLGQQGLNSALWSYWSRFGLWCSPEEKLGSGIHYRTAVLLWESVAKVCWVAPLGNDSNGRGESKEREVSSQSLTHMHRAGALGLKAAKTAISSAFLRENNANNDK